MIYKEGTIVEVPPDIDEHVVKLGGATDPKTHSQKGVGSNPIARTNY